MTWPLTFLPEARDDIDEAYAWYEQQRAGLGEDFLARPDDVLQQIGQTPLMHAATHRDVRRSLLPQFPYGVFYRVEANQVLVIAVYHSKRDPRGWQSRA